MKIIGGFLTTLGVVFFVLWTGARLYKSEVTWEQNVDGHLKRAADANTLDLAKEELDGVVKYLEENGVTSGYTSIMWRTPNEDIGFWYKNLKKSVEELARCQETCKTQLEQTNVLMKLRETLVDTGQSVKPTDPGGASIYPNNMAYMLWVIVSMFLMVIGFVIVASDPY